MNTNSNWHGALNMANADLKKYNISLQVEQEDNTYNINIVYPDHSEQYACGYFENELENLIKDACSWVVNTKEQDVGMTAGHLMQVFTDCRLQIIEALKKYVEQYGEPYSDYHQNVLGIEAGKEETVVKVANFYDAEGCVYTHCYGEDPGCKFESISISAIYLIQQPDNRKQLRAACFENVGEKYNDDESVFCIEPINVFSVNELFEMIMAIQNIKTK